MILAIIRARRDRGIYSSRSGHRRTVTAHSPSVERLEGRTYASAAPHPGRAASQGSAPPIVEFGSLAVSVIGKEDVSIPDVGIIDTTLTSALKPITRTKLEFFLSTDLTLDASDVKSVKSSIKNVALPAGVTTTVSPTVVFPTVPDGNYFVLARITTNGGTPVVQPFGDVIDGMGVGARTIVTPPKLDATVSGANPVTVVPGARQTVTVTLTNNGLFSFNDTGFANHVRLFASTDQTLDAGDVRLADLKRKISLEHHKSMDVSVSFRFPRKLTGSVFLLASADV